MKKLTLVLSLVAVVACFAAVDWAKYSVKPKDGFVPDEKTAIAIAVAVWTPIYGLKNLEFQKPYTAKLEGDVWRVEGTLPAGMTGGTATAIIAKEDGQIRAVWHTK
jgi:hypothetical protein